MTALESLKERLLSRATACDKVTQDWRMASVRPLLGECSRLLREAAEAIVVSPPAELKPEDVPAWVQIQAGNELSELVRLVRFAPGQPTGFLHSDFDANGLLWRWALKWARHMRVSPSPAPDGDGRYAQIRRLSDRLREVLSLLDDPCPYDKATTMAAARHELEAAATLVGEVPSTHEPLRVVVNGQPVEVTPGPVRDVIAQAIQRSGQIGAPIEQWELRTREGDVIPHDLPVDWQLTGGRLLFLNLGLPPALVGEAGTPLMERTACGLTRAELHDALNKLDKQQDCERGEHEWGAVPEGIRCRWCRTLVAGQEAQALWRHEYKPALLQGEEGSSGVSPASPEKESR